MNLWGRRLGIFFPVLAAGLVGVQAAHRWNAHASARVGSGPAIEPVLMEPVIRSHALQASAAAPARAALDVRSMAEPPRNGPVLAAGGSSPAPPPSVRGSAAVLQAAQPTRTFHDASYKVSFDYPASWTFTQKDGEISTFRLDARSAARNTRLRAVASLPSNPYPASTFSGAYVYLSVTPHSNAARCAAQAVSTGTAKPESREIAGLNFAHGHDEQKAICTVERDEIYTTFRKGACYRFDLAMNNFCGGEVSGVKDVTQQELDSVLARLQAVVQTIRFDPQ